MLFKRRNHRPFWLALWRYIWPSSGLKRAWLYLWHRVKRISEPPHAIALGFAVGAFVSCTPFLGLHLIIAASIAIIVGGNILASAMGTFVGNPITFPFIWLGTFNLGALILGRQTRDSMEPDLAEMAHWSTLIDPGKLFGSIKTVFEPVLLPMMVGALPIGLAVAVACYFVVKPAVRLYQLRRKRKLARLKAQ